MATAVKNKKRQASSAAPHPPISASLGNGIWQTASWTRPEETFEQDLNQRTCTCEAGKKSLWCKHLTSALLASFTMQLARARAADGVVVRSLLNRGVHQGRPDIEMALLLAAWEAARADWARLQAAEPGEEPAPEDGAAAVPIGREEYSAAVGLLSEGRKAA